MKRIVVFLMALAVSVPSFAWGKVGHATVARIAEDHLTPTTLKAVNEILDGRSIVEFASYADEFKSEKILQFNYGVKFNDFKTVGSYPHTFEVDMNYEPFRGYNDNGRYVKNCLWFIEHYSADLLDYKSLSKQDQFVKLVMLVHWVGDMHCPEHIRYNPEEMTIGYFNVLYQGDSLRYHTFWDNQCITDLIPWSFSDLAYLWDRSTEEEMLEIVKGDVYDWGRDAAKCSWPTHSIKPGDKLGKKWLTNSKALTRSQVTKAGYRLAHLLNMTFDSKYAKKYQKKFAERN